MSQRPRKKRKSRPGVCDVCGRAVVQSTPGQLALDRAHRHKETGEYWSSGHRYDEDDRLVEVACREHEPRSDWEMWVL